MAPKSLYEALHVDEAEPRTPGRAEPAAEPQGETAEAMCRRLLASDGYQASILYRIQMGELPAAVECLLYHYAFGKPRERVEHTGKDGAAIITEVRRVLIRANEADELPEPERPVVTH